MFTSYRKMEECFDLWSGKFEKECYKESRNKKITKENVKKFKDKCYLKGVGKGAVLFTVFRGKFSEGYNFKN